MKRSYLFQACLLSAAALLGNLAVVHSANAAEYSFKATNTTRDRITKVLVSENKKSWGFFDIGKGIKGGASVNLVWDKSTNDGACNQWVKAVWADGSESTPAKFDFCEEDLEIEF